LLSHQAHVGHSAHGFWVKCAVPFAEVNHLLIDTGEGGLGHDSLGVFQAAVGAPHFAAVANHGGHGGVHDHVVGRMEVGDAFCGVHHGQLRAVFVASVDVALDFIAQRRWQFFDLGVQIDHAVVDVHAQLFECRGVFLKCFFVEDLDAVTEHDGVRHLHHGGFDVQREHHASFAGVFDFLFVERAQFLFAHVHGVDDFTVEQGDFGLQDDGFTALGDEFHLHVAGFVQRHGLFAVIKVASVHVRHVRAGGLAPLGHGVGVFAGVFFHGAGGAAIRVAFTQHGVHGRACAFTVASLEFFFFVVFRALRVVW
jgi:hypothetical protein